MNSLKEMRPALVPEWSDANLPLTPDQITYGSNRKVFWDGLCGHRWQATVKNRSNGHGCPYCSGNAILIGFNDLASKYPSLVKEWSERNTVLEPSGVTPGSCRKVWWHCAKCGQEWEARVADRVAGSGCPVCAGERMVAGINDLASEHPELIMEWSERNPSSPAAVWSKSRENVWWKCRVCGHEWQAVVGSRVNGYHACPVCEKRITDVQNRMIAHVRSRAFQQSAVRFYATYDDTPVICGDESRLGIPLELYFAGKNAAIELSWPYQCTGSGKYLENAKNWLCLNAGIKLVRILSPDAKEFDNCICITRTDNSPQVINTAIATALEMIGIYADVDVLRDFQLIKNHEAGR